jgi:predicted RNase H-like HicB family nuclease
LKVMEEKSMQYNVILEASDEGFAVSVPGLPGCHSQGATEQEALDNIADAIREYQEVAGELARRGSGREVVIEV